jgi:hypothetical protein
MFILFTYDIFFSADNITCGVSYNDLYFWLSLVKFMQPQYVWSLVIAYAMSSELVILTIYIRNWYEKIPMA